MNLKEKEEKISIFKEQTNDLAKKLLITSAQKNFDFYPVLSVLTYSPEKKFSVSSEPVSMQFMHPKMKDFFVDYIIPQCVQSLKQEGYKVVCVAFVVDTFATRAPTDVVNPDMPEKEMRAKMKGYEKRDAIVVTYSTYDKTVSDIFVYKKQGNDVVFIEEMSQMQPHKSSRFTDLLKIDPNDN